MSENTPTVDDLKKLEESLTKVKNSIAGVADAFKAVTSGNISGALSGISGSLSTLGPYGIAAGAALQGVGAAADWLNNASKATVSLGESIMGLQKSTGLGAESVSTMSAVLGDAGIGGAAASDVIKSLSDDMHAAGKGANAHASELAALGIKVKDAQGNYRSTSDVMGDFADKFKSMKDPVERNAAAQKIFGSHWKEMLPLLAGGKKGMQEAAQKAKDYGLVLNGGSISAIKKYKDASKDADKATQGLKVQFGQLALPIKTFLAQGASKLLTWLIGLKPVLDRIGKAVVDFFQKSGAAKFMQQQFGVLVSWVKTNMPLIQRTIKTVMDAVNKVVKTVWPAISLVVKTNLNTIKILVSTIWNNIKTIVSTVLKAVLGVIKALMQIITGDWKGAWNTLKGVVKTVFDGIKQIVGNSVKGFVDIGKNIVQGIWKGITSLGGWLKGQITSWIKDHLPGPVVKALGIASPSKLFAGYGKNVVEGLTGGIKDNSRLIERARTGMIQTLSAKPQFATGSGGLAMAGAGGAGAAGGVVFSRGAFDGATFNITDPRNTNGFLSDLSRQVIAAGIRR